MVSQTAKNNHDGSDRFTSHNSCSKKKEKEKKRISLYFCFTFFLCGVSDLKKKKTRLVIQHFNWYRNANI
jgi:hypothetical protein